MTRKLVGLALAALAVTALACDGSKKELEKTVAQMQQISAEKDSLLKDVMSTSQFIADVNTELAKVKSRSAGKPVAGQAGELESNMTPAQQREAIKAKVAELTQRLNESESRLAASRNRVRDLTANNAQLSSQMAAYDSTIASFKTIIDNQKTEIASLTEQINALQAENTTLKAEKATLTAEKTQLTAEKDQLTTEKNTVYYVIGTEDELFKKGIIQKQGGMLGLALGEQRRIDSRALGAGLRVKAVMQHRAAPGSRDGGNARQGPQRREPGAGELAGHSLQRRQIPVLLESNDAVRCKPMSEFRPILGHARTTAQGTEEKLLEFSNLDTGSRDRARQMARRLAPAGIDQQ